MAFKITGEFDVNTGNSLQATDAVSKGMQDAANSTVSLKKELREMQQQLATLDPNSKAFQELSVRAGEVKDKINDASEAVRANAGNAFEGLANNTGLLTDRLMNLDFEGVASAARGMASSMGRIDMKTLTAGVKQAGSAIMAMGEALLMNPIFWIGATIAAVVVYWDELSVAVGINSEESMRNAKLQSELSDELATQSKQVGVQTAQINALFDAVTDQNLAEAERKQALQDLQTLYPDVFANQDIDINNTTELTNAKLKLIATIQAEAKANAARALLEKKYAEQFELEAKFQKELANNQNLINSEFEGTKFFTEGLIGGFNELIEVGQKYGAVGDLAETQEKLKTTSEDILALEKLTQDVILEGAKTEADKIREKDEKKTKSHKTHTERVVKQEDKLQQQLDAMRKENELARMDQDAREIAEFENKYAKLRAEAQGNADKMKQIDQLEFDELTLLLEKQSARQVEITLKTQAEEQKIKDEQARKNAAANEALTAAYDAQEKLRIESMQEGVDKELALLALKYDEEIAAAGANAELQKQITEKYVAAQTAIEDKAREEKRKKDEEDRQAAIKAIEDNLNLATQGFSALSALGDVYFANRKNKLAGDEKASKALAEKQFKFNKKMQLAGAIIDAGKAITASLAASPVAIGPVPNPAGIASLAFASVTSAANIAKILATKFDSTGGAAGSTTPSISGGGGNEGGAPQFNPLASAFINNRPGQTGPTPAYVLAGDVTSAQEARNKVQDLARL